MLIHLKGFAGLVPKASDRELPPNHASLAENTQLYSGEIRGLAEPLAVADLSGEIFTVRRAYRLFDGSTSLNDTVGDWVAFDDTDVNFVRGALKNDSFDRYYASGGRVEPVVNSAVGWAAGDPPLALGVPSPTIAPTVSFVEEEPTDESVFETRAYVYTFVNEWGEESGPSPASVPATGIIGSSWLLSDMQTIYPITGTHNPIAKTRIYRTITGTRSITYRFVAELDPPLETYNDIQSIDAVSLNEPLPSNGWELPPAGLQGIVNMANGIMVGFVGHDLYFSEPYRPHAWPAAYIVSVDSDIIGLGVYQSGVVVCTSANPFVATGSHPASIVLTKLDDVEPCLSFRSIVNGLNGVTYASLNGLVLVNQSGAQNITKPLMTRNEWRQEYAPESTQSASDGTKTLAFNTLSGGYLFSPLEPLGYLVKLQDFADVQSVQTDPFTGEAYMVSRDVVLLWNPTSTAPLSYTWKSKVFELPMPVNMGAFRLQYEDVIGGADSLPAYDYTIYNLARFDASTIIVPLSSPTLFDDVLFQGDFEGANGATAYTEESQFTEAATFGGNAQLSTTSPIFDTSHLELDDAAFTFIRFPIQPGNVALWDGAGKYMTCEVAFRVDALPVANGEEQGIIFVGSNDNPFLRVMVTQSGGTDFFRAGFAGSQGLTPISGLIAGTDYFMVIEADNTGGAGNCVERVWLGTVASGTATLIDTNTGLTARDPTGMDEFIYVGRDGDTGDQLDGAIDHARVTVSDTARYGTGPTITIPDTYATANPDTTPFVTNPLDTLNLYPLNGVRTETGVTDSPPVTQYRQPLAGSPIFPLDPFPARDSIRIRIYGDGVLRYQSKIVSNDMQRMPSGYKADKWQIEFTTAQNIYSFKMAGTAKELAKA